MLADRLHFHAARLFVPAVAALTLLGWMLVTSEAAASTVNLRSQSATLLPDGRWVMIGGEIDGKPTATIVLVDPRLDRTTSLPVRLNIARAGHTATVLPNGLVLVIGGVGADGRVATVSELFDPLSASITPLSLGLVPRAEHTATLLTNGQVLIVGGIDAQGAVVADVEVLDTFSGSVQRFDARIETARFGHFAALLPSAPVLIWGGLDSDNRPATRAELFEPAIRRFAPVDRRTEGYLPDPDAALGSPVITGVHPDPDQAIAIDATLALRFSKPVDPSTLGTDTVTLFGPSGPVPIGVVGAEGGMLAFVTPRGDLNPDARYTLFVNGAKDMAGQGMSMAIVSFRTGDVASAAPHGNAFVAFAPPAPSSNVDGDAATALAKPAASTPAIGAGDTTTSPLPRIANDRVKQPPGRGRLSDTAFTLDPARNVGCGQDDKEDWIPDEAVIAREGWRSLREDSALPPELVRIADDGVTALTGQVLRMNGMPLANATVQAGSQATTTDELGLFLLTDVVPGPNVVIVDGSSSSCANAEYGVFEMKAVAQPGVTTPLPHAVFMPRLDSARMVKIDSPTKHAVVIKHPKMPGLEIEIPAGTIIRDRAGKIVTRVGLTPMPIDRNPLPLPALHDFRLYYTMQPSGASLEGTDGRPRQARVTYPNYHNHDPGETFLLWSYDPFEREWHVYGEGKVSKNGKTIEPDPGVGMYSFGGFSAAPPNQNPPCDSGACCGGGGSGPFSASAGDPVMCMTGAFVHTNVDLQVNDVNPLTLARTHYSSDWTLREFGRGMIAGLDYNLFNPTPGTFSELKLVLPSGGRVLLTCTSGCTAAATAQFRAEKDPGLFFGATMKMNVDRWELRTRDGSLYTFWNWGGKIMSLRDRYGNTTTYTRVPALAGALSRVTTANGRWIDFTYTGSRITRAQDSAGRAWTYTYDTSGSTVMLAATNPLGGVWQYTYDFAARMQTVRDPRNNLMVQNVYDANGRVTQQTYADNTTTRFAYVVDAQNRVTQTDVTDQRGNIRRMTFDASGFVTSNTFALGRPEAQTSTSTRAAGSNLMSSQTDALGRRTDYTYDANGNLRTITRLAGTADAVTTTYTYGTPFNLVTSITDPLGHAMTFTHDAAGNVTRTTDANGNYTEFTYTPQGQVKTTKNALGHTTTHTYLAGIVETIADPLGRVTRTFADSAGRVVAIRDPGGNVTSTEYDALDRVTKVVDPLSGTVRYEYDGNGNLTAHVDQRGNRIEYTYDAMNRVATRRDPLLRTESYVYDQASMLQRFTDRNSQVSGFTYDALNRRTQAGFGATPANPTAYASTIDFTFDGGNRLIQANDSLNGSITRTYDGLDRLTSETTSLATVSYTYDAVGRRLSRTVPGQPTLTYAWDNANRLLGVTQGTQSVGFTYDAANRRTRITLPDGIDINYAYDNASQLTSITYKNGATTLGDLIYSYDAAGRRTKIAGSYARSDLPNAIATTSHNGNNQLTAWGGPTLTYDPNGNLTADGTYTYVWNARGQLAQVKQGATTIASYRYDALGRRKEKVVGGVTTRFVYDGQNFVQERDASDAVTANVLTGPGLDEVYARTKGAATSSFLLDHLGTIVAEADATGTVHTSYTYEPYGRTTQTGAASDNGQRYTGREQDLADLYYYRARYYSPRLDRFLSEDPAGIDEDANLYAYVAGDPISRIDPDGLRARKPREPPRRQGAPRSPVCITWRCTICEPLPPLSCPPTSRSRCTTFYVSSPPGHPGEGGFAGAGGYAGDAAKMSECMCIKNYFYPF